HLMCSAGWGETPFSGISGHRATCSRAGGRPPKGMEVRFLAAPRSYVPDARCPMPDGQLLLFTAGGHREPGPDLPPPRGARRTAETRAAVKGLLLVSRIGVGRPFRPCFWGGRGSTA